MTKRPPMILTFFGEKILVTTCEEPLYGRDGRSVQSETLVNGCMINPKDEIAQIRVSETTPAEERMYVVLTAMQITLGWIAKNKVTRERDEDDVSPRIARYLAD